MTIPLAPPIVDAHPTSNNGTSMKPLHTCTPLVHSTHLSGLTQHNVYLKLDSDQPSGSFKIRGIGAICQAAVAANGSAGRTHLVSSSGGNAGLAVAHAAAHAGVGCTIFVPSSTEVDVVDKLMSKGARVVVGGDAWDQADAAAREEVRKRGAVYVHPFEGDRLVAGHSGLVDEVYTQMPEQGQVDVLISSVGGGGLLRGIIQGVQRQSGQAPTLIAVQNFGVDSFNRSFDQYIQQGKEQVVTLTAIESKCTSMGTKNCSSTTLHDAIHFHTSPSPSSSSTRGEIITLTVTDHLSASACWQFASLPLPDGRKRMVELSCASALTPVFHPWILDRLIEASAKLKAKVQAGQRLNIVVEVCGGSKVNTGLLEEYERSTGNTSVRDRVRINGVDFPAGSN